MPIPLSLHNKPQTSAAHMSVGSSTVLPAVCETRLLGDVHFSCKRQQGRNAEAKYSLDGMVYMRWQHLHPPSPASERMEQMGYA